MSTKFVSLGEMFKAGLFSGLTFSICFSLIATGFVMSPIAYATIIQGHDPSEISNAPILKIIWAILCAMIMTSLPVILILTLGSGVFCLLGKKVRGFIFRSKTLHNQKLNMFTGLMALFLMLLAIRNPYFLTELTSIFIALIYFISFYIASKTYAHQSR